MALLRSEEMSQKYREHKAHLDSTKCVLCDMAALQEFKYWKVTINDFPYDKIAEVHHMLLPLRHATELELTAEEDREMIEIKESYVNANYDFIFEPTTRNKSVPKHFHVHLIVTKRDIK